MFYDLDDMKLEEVPEPELRPGWVILKPIIVQPSITEVVLTKGIRPRQAMDFRVGLPLAAGRRPA